MKAKTYKNNKGRPTPKKADGEVSPFMRALGVILDPVFTFGEFLFSKRSVFFRLAFCVAGLVVSLIYIHRMIGVFGTAVFALLIFAIYMKEWADVTLKWQEAFDEKHPWVWRSIDKVVTVGGDVQRVVRLVVTFMTFVASFFFWPRLWAIGATLGAFWHFFVLLGPIVNKADRQKKAQSEAAKVKEAVPNEPEPAPLSLASATNPNN